MSKDMKLIMESWRRVINEEEQKDTSQKFRTVGQVKRAIAGAIKAKKNQISGEKATQLGVDTLIGAIPVVGSAASIFKGLAGIARDAYQLDDAALIKVGMDTMNIDKMLSMIVDDKVENDFLNNWMKKFAKMPDDTPLEDISATKALQQFLRDEYYTRMYKTRGGEK